MLVTLLISATLEAMFKRLLYQDKAMSAIRECLKGKVLQFELAELRTPIILIFSEHQIDVLNAWADATDCTVRIRFSTFSALLEHQQLTQLIKKGLLDIEGDLQCVQHFITLLNMAEFNMVEHLTPWIGDIAAEFITRAVKRWLTASRRFLRTEQGILKQAITDEWCLVPSTLELAWFYGEVNDVTRAYENLAVRLDMLEVSR